MWILPAFQQLILWCSCILKHMASYTNCRVGHYKPFANNFKIWALAPRDFSLNFTVNSSKLYIPKGPSGYKTGSYASENKMPQWLTILPPNTSTQKLAALSLVLSGIIFKRLLTNTSEKQVGVGKTPRCSGWGGWTRPYKAKFPGLVLVGPDPENTGGWAGAEDTHPMGGGADPPHRWKSKCKNTGTTLNDTGSCRGSQFTFYPPCKSHSPIADNLKMCNSQICF